MRKLKNLTKRILGLKHASGNFEVNFLNEYYGHDKSKVLGKPVNKDGTAIPWYTYPAIEFLEQFDLSDKTVFEWGCGNSSLFYAARTKAVTSVEHDNTWYDQMLPIIKGNQELKYVPLEGYPSSIKEFDRKFDIIVIDGQRRFDCTKEAFPFLRDNGMIILDNSDWFYVSAALLREKYGLFQIDFHGFGPINNYTFTTSVYFTKDFDFPLKEGRRPLNAKGGLLHDEKEIIKNEDQTYNTRNYEWAENNFR